MGILLGIAIALTLAWFSLDRMVQFGIEQNVTTALGVPTRIDKLRLSLSEGKIAIENLTVENPDGFNTPYLLKVNSLVVQMKLISLISDTVEIQRVELDGLDVNVEQKFANSNILAVGAKLQKQRDEQGKQGDRGEKKVKADYVLIKNVSANVKLSGLGQLFNASTVQVPTIELKDVGTDNVQGLLLSDFMRKLVVETFAAVANQVKASLPK
jgi:uncharacterized protein involved in outer membrane biogenesis